MNWNLAPLELVYAPCAMAAMVVVRVPLLFAHVVRLLELKTAPLLAAARVGVAALEETTLEALVTALPQFQVPIEEGASGSDRYASLIRRGEAPDHVPPVEEVFADPDRVRWTVLDHPAGIRIRRIR